MQQMRKLDKIKVNDFNVISFDLFDTLIKRACYSPKDIFKIIEKKYGENFYSRRINAEIKARKESNYEEVTLEEIYINLRPYYQNIDEILNYEIQTERTFCKRNNCVYSFLQKCKAYDKKIILITDIYLSRDVICAILQENQIEYDRLFISSELRKTKRTGALYRYVKNQFNINPHRWLHIGDNIKSDYLIPKKIGIHSVLLQTDDYSNLLFHPSKRRDSYNYKRLCSIIRAHLSSNDDVCNNKDAYFYHLGYEGLGPVLYGFIKWLSDEFENQEIEKVFFLSRDGQLMQKAYKEINVKHIYNEYMYASRKAFIVPTLFLDSSLENISKSIFWPKYGTVNAFIKKVGLNPSLYKNRLYEYGLSPDIIYKYKELFHDSSFQKFFESIKNDIEQNSKKENMAVQKYLNDIGFTGNIAIVDIGWHGNMQIALQKLIEQNNINVTIHGFYIGLVPNHQARMQYKSMMNAYLFDTNKNEKLFLIERLFTSIFEMLFSANHGSIIKFYLDDGKSKVEMDKFEYSQNDDYRKIQRIQEGALCFVNDVSLMSDIINIFDSQTVFQNLIKIGLHPRKYDAENLGNITIMDNDIRNVAQPKSLFHSLLHFKETVNNFKVSSWRIGFLKRLIKINLPYYQIYYFLKNHLKDK